MIAISEMWPFSPKKAHAATGPDVLKDPDDAPKPRGWLGKGIKGAKEGEGGIGGVFNRVAKRNKMLAAAAGND